MSCSRHVVRKTGQENTTRNGNGFSHGSKEMTSLSPGTVLVWKIAAYEALRLSAENIEKEHIFIGIMSLEKMLKKGSFAGSQETFPKVEREWNALSGYLDITGHDPVVLRRLMRRALGKGTSSPARKSIHRSLECRQYFESAARFAGDTTLTSNDLFSAIMDKPGEMITFVLKEGRQYSAAMRETDIMLPSEKSLNEIGGTTEMHFDIRDILSRDISRLADSLIEWSLDSQEYHKVLAALNRKGTSLALLFLDDNDLPGLLSALRMLVPWSGKFKNELIKCIRELENTSGKNLSEDPQNRIRDLLRRIEDQDVEDLKDRMDPEPSKPQKEG